MTAEGPAVFDLQKSTEDRIVLAMPEGRDRDLLAEWLGSFQRYTVSTATSPAELPPAYDLCLVTGHAVDGFADDFLARADAEGSGYLPHALVLFGDDVDDDAARMALGTDSPVTDVLSLPMEKAVLERRIETLLQARRASVTLAEREQQYRQLVQLTPETILLLDGGEIIYANRTAMELFDTEQAETLQGRSLSAFVTEEDVPTLRSLLDDVRGGEDPTETDFVELAMRSAAGDLLYVEATGVEVQYDGAPKTQLVLRDLTNKKERQQQLTLFGRAIEAAAQGITIADAGQEDMPLVYANEGFERITGYTVDDVLGRNCRFLQGANTDEETVAQMRAAIEDQRPVSVELLNYRQDGTPFWNQLDIVPVRDDGGDVSHFLGLQRDVTDRKRREQRLSVLNRVLRHNLRNKMNVIQVYADRLAELEGAGDDPSAISQAADELLTISDQIRKFDTVVTGGREDLYTVDLLAVAGESIASLEDSAGDVDIDLTAPASAPILAHETLRPALTDLVALTETVADPKFDVTITVADGRVTLEVVDKGGAIDREDLEIVSQDGETPLQHLQTLELWLVRWAVEESHGEFTVDTGGEYPVVRMRFLHAEDHPAG